MCHLAYRIAVVFNKSRIDYNMPLYQTVSNAKFNFEME